MQQFIIIALTFFLLGISAGMNLIFPIIGEVTERRKKGIQIATTIITILVVVSILFLIEYK